MLTHCKLTRKRQLKLLEFFVCEVTARTAANMIDINYHICCSSTQKYAESLLKIRKAPPPFRGAVEVDESYFGCIRKGKRGRGAAGKIPVFGRLKRDGKVHAYMVKDTKSGRLMPIIKEKVILDSIVYSDSYKSYEGIDVSGFHHFRINHHTDFALGSNHINGIENFWSQAKRILRKYNEIPKEKVCASASAISLVFK